MNTDCNIKKPKYFPFVLASLTILVCSSFLLSCLASFQPPTDATFYSPVLNISERNLTDLSEEYYEEEKIQKENIRWFIANDNQLEVIKKTFFEGFTNLENIYLGNNSTTSVESEVFSKLKNLKRLYLDKNQLQTFDATPFAQDALLEIIYLNENNFSDLPLDLINSDISESLYFSKNKIKNVQPNFLSSIEKLKLLSLASNQITSLPTDAFKNEKNLQEVILSTNEISQIGENAFSASKLKTIRLRSNQLSAVPKEAFLSDNELEILDLSHNKIECLSAVDFEKLHGLVSLILDNNNFKGNQEGCIDDNAIAKMTNLELLTIDILRDGETEGVPLGSPFLPI